MNLKKLAAIYVGNVSGVFRGYKEFLKAEGGEGAVIGLIAYTLLLPVSLTLFAGIKSFFDYYTRRKELTPTEFNQLIGDIDNIDHTEAMQGLVETITNYKDGSFKQQARSISSIKLAKDVNQVVSKTATDIAAARAKFGKESQREQSFAETYSADISQSKLQSNLQGEEKRLSNQLVTVQKRLSKTF